MRSFVALALVVALSGCSGLDELWNGKVVDPGPVDPQAVPWSEVSQSTGPEPDLPVPTPPEPSGITAESSTMPPPAAKPGTPSGNSSSTVRPGMPCEEGEAQRHLEAAQEYLRTLQQRHVRETVAGQVNGSYVMDERLYDLQNATIAWSSRERQTHVVAIGAEYALTSAQGGHGRNDVLGGVAALWLDDMAAGHPLSNWMVAPASEFDMQCEGNAADRAVLATLNGTSAVDSRIEQGRLVLARIQSTQQDLQITYDFAPPAPVLDANLPRRPLSADLVDEQNATTMRSGESRSLDGHLVVHGLDAQGYAVLTLVLDGSVRSDEAESWLAYTEDGDGLLGPGDRIAWGGAVREVRVFDAWAGAFATSL